VRNPVYLSLLVVFRKRALELVALLRKVTCTLSIWATLNTHERKKHMQQNTHDILRHPVQPFADRVAQHLEIISKNFEFVPGVPGFSWNSSLITWY